jgi:hypothetical protein
MPSLTAPAQADSTSSTSSPYFPTWSPTMDNLTLSDAGPPGVTPSWIGLGPPVDTVSSFSADTTQLSHGTGITVPQTGRRLTRAPLNPADRAAFTRAHFPARIPIRVYYICRQFRRRKRVLGGIICWRLRVEEAYPGAFEEHGISISPGLYIFKDLGNPLCFAGTRIGGESILFTFPILHSPIWTTQRISDPSSPNAILTPCYLPLAISRPPRVGGFLHPHFYGVPGHLDTCKQSHQAYYLVMHTFEGGGTVICRSWASAYYQGRAASHFSRSGPITMKGHYTENAVLASVQLTTPSVVKRPEVVPYLHDQLAYFDMLENPDIPGTIHDPVTIDGRTIERTSPQLFRYNPESHSETLWAGPDGPNTTISASYIVAVDLTPRPPSSALSGIEPSIPTEIQSVGPLSARLSSPLPATRWRPDLPLSSPHRRNKSAARTASSRWIYRLSPLPQRSYTNAYTTSHDSCRANIGATIRHMHVTSLRRPRKWSPSPKIS